jgi:UDP:flavonoid glycosyltransferase YjiC (YdhE family)
LNAEEQVIYDGLPVNEREGYLMKVVLMDHMADVHDTLQAHFADFRKRYGMEKPLISLFDCTLTGHHPILLGSPGIRPDASVGINLHPLTVDSNDTFPWAMGKAPHQGPDRAEVHRKAYKEVERASEGAYDYWWGKLKELGAKQDTYPALLPAMNLLPDHVLTLGVPEFEFPRSDLRANVRHFGAFKEVGKRSEMQMPSWWDDVTRAKEGGKKIVLISQGTLEADFSDLTLPALDVLKDRTDLLIIATFASVEPEDVVGLVVPENARVAKFVPFDVLLPLVGPTVAE